jgi:RND family efflux transporter MFP subunit
VSVSTYFRRAAQRVCSLALVVATACTGKENAAAGDEAKAVAEVTAVVDTVRTALFAETVDGVASISARVGHVALLAAPSPTRVTKIYVSVGDHVAANAALVDLEQPQFDAAVASAEAALRAAELASARATRLVEAGVAPRKDAESALAELEAAKLNAMTAKRARDLSHVRAPFAGVVTRLQAAVGANADVGQPLVEITDPSVLDAVIAVAPSDASGIRAGQSADLFEGNAAGADPIARASVADISAVVDSATRGVPIRLAIRTTTRTLRVGESVFARIVVAQHAKAVVVADDALVPTGEGFHVFVVDSAGVAHAREVTVGGRASHQLWITKGLAAGELVVTKGAYGMDDGAKVVGGKP